MSPSYNAPADSLSLLRTISQGDRVPPLTAFRPKQLHWIIETGFAPLFCFLSRNDSNNSDTLWWRELQAANLSVRLLNSVQLETLREILNRCEGLLPPITVLKGCSIATEFYPAAHLRVMRDLDILVKATDQPVVETVLLKMGFRQQSSNHVNFYYAHHHSMPFFHPGTGVWVEVHRDIFPRSEEVGTLRVFSGENVAAESRLSHCEGITVMRLSPELQLVYTASHWALGLIGLIHRGGLFAFLDTIFILRAAPQSIRWDAIFDWVSGSVAATHLYLLLSYLHCNRIYQFDPEVLRELFRRQKSFGRINLELAHRLIARYLVAGKIPLARGKLSILWETLLRNEGPVRNLASFSSEIFSLPESLKNKSGLLYP